LAGTIRTNRNWTFSSGILTPGSSTVVFAGTLTVTGSQSFNDVVIRGAVTVPAGTDLAMAALTMPSAVAFTVNGSVTVSGALTLTDGSIGGSGSVAVGGDVSQASTFDGGTGLVVIDGAGDQIFTGSATATAGTLPNLDIVKPSGTLTLAGTIRTNRNWTFSSGILTPGSSTVVFAGTPLISVAGTAFSNVTIDSGLLASGVTLVQGPLVITGTLSLTSGTVTTGGSRVIVTSTGVVVRTSGYVIGNLQRHIPIGSAVNIDFEIGDTTGYRPVVVGFGTVTMDGDLTASTSAGDHADISNAGISATNSVNRWWTITNSATLFDYYDVIFNFDAADLDPAADPSAFIISKRDGATWTQPLVLARSATTIEAGGLASFSEFVVGHPSADVGVLMVGSPEPVLVAGTLTYTLTVQQPGPSPASNVVLTDVLPAGVVFQSADSSQGSCIESSGTVTCFVGDLASNATVTINIWVTVLTPGTITNVASVSANEDDPQTTNNTASWTSLVAVPTSGTAMATVLDSDNDSHPAERTADSTTTTYAAAPSPGDGFSEQGLPPEATGTSYVLGGAPSSPQQFENDRQTGNTTAIDSSDRSGSVPAAALVIAGMVAILSFIGVRRVDADRYR
jgi:uncharacterized repeat protein (TIGR01451 family)